ncbi:hypothetical protein SCH4B_4373 [Ruegeria sp. TrichCH4B]|nr:hypothetical protein SCH4B_4373 [Ruegeria sp. TrichCH4B]
MVASCFVWIVGRSHGQARAPVGPLSGWNEPLPVKSAIQAQGHLSAPPEKGLEH